MSTRCASSHSRYGCCAASSRLISSSSTMRPFDVSTRKIAARMEPLLDQHVLGRDVEHADFGRHDDEVVLGHVVARRTQPVAIEHRADDGAVGERDRRRAVPRLHQRRVVLVERLPVGAHLSCPLHGSGIIIRMACGSDRPPSRGTRARCRTSPCRCRLRGSRAGASRGRRRAHRSAAALRARASS